MKVIFVTLFLTAVFLLNGQNVLRVNRIDSISQDYEIENVSSLIFSDFTGYDLKIKKTDGSEVVYALSKILNLTFTDSSGIETQEILNKLGISLLRNYPNPFNPETTINFVTHDTGLTKVEIYNSHGQKVTTLHNGYLSAGSHSLKWNANEKNTSSGTYFIKVSQNEEVLSSKMLLIK